MSGIRNILQSDGWQEKSGAWKLADSLRDGGFNVTERLCDEDFAIGPVVQASDLQACDAAAVYSLSCGDAWALMHDHPRAVPMEILFIVLGCMNWGDGQIAGEWHPQPWFKRGVCFQIDQACPKSNPLQGDLLWVDILDPEAFGKIIAKIKDGGCANVSCLALWPIGTDPITMHTQSQNRREVINLIVELAEWLDQYLISIEAMTRNVE